VRFLDHTQTDRQTHTHTHSLGMTPLDEGSVLPRHLYLTAHNTHKRENPCPGGIRIRSTNKRAAADPRLRQRGHWNRLRSLYPKVTNKYRPTVDNTSYDALIWQLSVIFHYYSRSRYKYYPENSSTNSLLCIFFP